MIHGCHECWWNDILCFQLDIDIWNKLFVAHVDDLWSKFSIAHEFILLMQKSVMEPMWSMWKGMAK